MSSKNGNIPKGKTILGTEREKRLDFISSKAKKRQIQREKIEEAKKQKIEEKVSDDDSDDDSDSDGLSDEEECFDVQVELLSFYHVRDIKRSHKLVPPGVVLPLNMKNIPWNHYDYSRELNAFESYFETDTPVWADLGEFGRFFVTCSLELKHLVKFILDWSAANHMLTPREMPEFGVWVETDIKYKFRPCDE